MKTRVDASAMLRRDSSLLFQPKSSSLRDATLPHTDLSNLRIPAPPPLPETIVEGFNSQDYWHLIYSLSEWERKQVLDELVGINYPI